MCSSVWTGRQVIEVSITATVWKERPYIVPMCSPLSLISLVTSLSFSFDENPARTDDVPTLLTSCSDLCIDGMIAISYGYSGSSIGLVNISNFIHQKL